MRAVFWVQKEYISLAENRLRHVETDSQRKQTRTTEKSRFGGRDKEPSRAGSPTLAPRRAAVGYCDAELAHGPCRRRPPDCGRTLRASRHPGSRRPPVTGEAQGGGGAAVCGARSPPACGRRAGPGRGPFSPRPPHGWDGWPCYGRGCQRPLLVATPGGLFERAAGRHRCGQQTRAAQEGQEQTEK